MAVSQLWAGRGTYKENTTLVSTEASCSIIVFTRHPSAGVLARSQPVWAGIVRVFPEEAPSLAEAQDLDGMDGLLMGMHWGDQQPSEVSPAPLLSFPKLQYRLKNNSESFTLHSWHAHAHTVDDTETGKLPDNMTPSPMRLYIFPCWLFLTPLLAYVFTCTPGRTGLWAWWVREISIIQLKGFFPPEMVGYSK